jgi:hypothetical protein
LKRHSANKSAFSNIYITHSLMELPIVQLLNRFPAFYGTRKSDIYILTQKFGFYVQNTPRLSVVPLLISPSLAPLYSRLYLLTNALHSLSSSSPHFFLHFATPSTKLFNSKFSHVSAFSFLYSPAKSLSNSHPPPPPPSLLPLLCVIQRTCVTGVLN